MSGSDSHLYRPPDDRIRREWGTVGESDLGLPQAARAAVVEDLNDTLSGLYILFNQVRKHDWLVEGAETEPLQGFLGDAADRLSEATDDLAVRVHALGGVPVCGPMGVRQHAPVTIEPPHHYDVRSSLSRDLDGYAALAVRFRDGIDLAESHGDTGTGELLRGHLRTVEEDARRIQQFLADDTLVQFEA